MILAAVLGFWLLWRERSWRETLLLAWIIVPVAFFQFWPVKGFQYLLPIAPAIAVLAGRALGRGALVTELKLREQTLRSPWLPVRGHRRRRALLAGPVLAASPGGASGPMLAGAGGVPGGREAGHWIDANMPEGAKFLTIGPSMANILQFYGHRKAMGISVSTNPLRRNPSYQPVINPDLQLRRASSNTWSTTPFRPPAPTITPSAAGLLETYNGRVVHEELVPVWTNAERQRTAGDRHLRGPAMRLRQAAPFTCTGSSCVGADAVQQACADVEGSLDHDADRTHDPGHAGEPLLR